MNARFVHVLPVILLLGVVGLVLLLERNGPERRDPATDGPIHAVVVSPLDDGRVKLVHRALGVMGTEVTLTLLGEDEAALRGAAEKAFARIEELEARLSGWRTDSDVSRINRGAGRGVPVDAVTARLVQRAVAITKRTAGAFDPTAGPILALWKDREDEPGAEEIAAARALVGADRVRVALRPIPSVGLAEGMRLDLGGIAKGTIVDAAGRSLIESGVTSFLVNAGGDVLAHGDGPDGDGILVDLRDPRGGRSAVLAGERLRLHDRAACTSGSYERGGRVAGRRVSHIVDPRTGRPVTDGVLQATVVAPLCETADALATALMVLGRDGLRLVEEMEGVEALLVLRADDGAETAVTSGYAALRAEDGR
jgi:thiamine biosynthesis lipoprotein